MEYTADQKRGSSSPGCGQEPHNLGPGSKSPGEVHSQSISAAALQVRCAPHESEPGHTFRLAQSLSEDPKPERSELPDGTYLPVPDQVLDNLDSLSGCAVRLSVLMIRAAYSWVEDLDEFRATSRLFGARQIRDEAGGLGMSRESLRRAANELEERGWIEQRKQAGQATAYRWKLSVPRSRYTPIPAPLFHAHQGLSHSALTLLLSVIRATLGWAATEDGTTKYKRTAELSTSDLRAMTGLSRPTVQSAREELEAKSVLYTRRKHEGAPWEYAVDFSFIRQHLQKSSPPTNREKSSNKHTREEQPNPDHAHTKGNRRGSATAYRITENWEEEAIGLLCAEPIEMNPGVARDLVICRAQKVVEGAIKEFRRRRSDIDNPAGSLRSAIDNLRFGPTLPDKSPNVQQSSGGETPIAQAFENLTEKHEGWEWDEEEDTRRRGRSGSPDRGLNVEEITGATHSQMCDLIDTLSVTADHFETVDRPGKNPLFVPSKELANWAYHRVDSGSERFQEAARRVVNLRARPEGRESPLSEE